MSDKPQVVLWAPASALVELCGISLLERNLRLLQRLGFSEALVVTADAEVVRKANDPPSWARCDIRTEVRTIPGGELTLGQLRELVDRDRPVLSIPANNYYDSRLLSTLGEGVETTALIDSDPPAALSVRSTNERKRFSGAALLTPSFLGKGDGNEGVLRAIEKEAGLFVDAATQPDYIPGMRRHLRPVWFPVPPPENKRRAETVILDAARKFPALIYSPIQTAIVKLICRSSITPMQVTWFTFILGWGVAYGYLRGWFWLSTLAAIWVGILDGVDGRLARVKVETTKFGAWEHYLDYSFEIFWWLALGYYFHQTDTLAWGPVVGLTLIVAELLERPFGRRIQLKTGCSPNDFAPIDRAFRYIWARRNILIAIFLLGLIVNRPAQAFIAMCAWQVVTTLFSITRWFWICVCHSLSEASYASATSKRPSK